MYRIKDYTPLSEFEKFGYGLLAACNSDVGWHFNGIIKWLPNDLTIKATIDFDYEYGHNGEIYLEGRKITKYATKKYIKDLIDAGLVEKTRKRK